MVTAGANFIVGNGAIILQGVGYATIAGGGAFMAVDAVLMQRRNGGGRFPLDNHVRSYPSNTGKFGESRDGGGRRHAGVDLYAPVGTFVYSVKAGKVMQNPYLFYRDSYAIEIDHGDFIARYCEIDVMSGLTFGSYVHEGQLIGAVSNLSLNQSMLHFELYSGESSGSLTNRNNPPFFRRNDLLNPTPFLNLWLFK